MECPHGVAKHTNPGRLWPCSVSWFVGWRGEGRGGETISDSKSSDAAFNPGGEFRETLPWGRDLFDLRIYPRHNIYLSTDQWGGFVVDATISQTIGQPYCNSLGNSMLDIAAGVRMNMVVFRTDTGQTVVERMDVPVNATGVESFFALADFVPRMEPYEIIVRTTQPRCALIYQSSTLFYRLPARTDGGSAVRIDNKYGGVAISTSGTNKPAVWKDLFPYSFYVDWGNFLATAPDRLEYYAMQGYNAVHPTPGIGLAPWGEDFSHAAVTKFDQFMNEAERLGLYVMYDMRWSYKNLTFLSEQVKRYSKRKHLLTWYTGDEPDGNGDPLDATTKAYTQIKTLDPYRPVSLVLNCQNFHYREYSAGADIILTDPYPVGANMTFSVQHNTPCNSTYGDCGCDNCEGRYTDVSNRLETFKYYQHNLNIGPKVFWGVPQAFGGSEYWSRPPNAAEYAIMSMLYINHGATGVVAWNFPTTKELTSATSTFAKFFTSRAVTDFLLNAKPLILSLPQSNFDAAAWRIGNQLMFSIIHLSETRYVKDLVVGLGVTPVAMRMLWPPNDQNWFVGNKSIIRSGMGAREVNVFLLQTE
jgi:hypothetical protein